MKQEKSQKIISLTLGMMWILAALFAIQSESWFLVGFDMGMLIFTAYSYWTQKFTKSILDHWSNSIRRNSSLHDIINVLMHQKAELEEKLKKPKRRVKK